MEARIPKIDLLQLADLVLLYCQHCPAGQRTLGGCGNEETSIAAHQELQLLDH